MIINNPCHMTKMAAMGIAGKKKILHKSSYHELHLQDHWCFGLFSGADDIFI